MAPAATLTTLSTWRRAVASASRAPSIHNTQPWRFAVRTGVLEVYVDPERQLRVLDPRARQLLISCGCAVLNARVSLAAAGIAVDVDRRRDPLRPNLVARLLATGGVGDHDLARLAGAVEARHTNRRRFERDPVDEKVVEALVAAARHEGVTLVPVVREEHRASVARLSQFADHYELADPAYRAELRQWTTDDPRRPDGVPSHAVPRVDGTDQDEIPLRDFDSTGMGWLPGDTHSSSHQTLLLLTTDRDDEKSWLRVGEALERVLLELTVHGYSASPLTQIIEVAHTHELLRAELGLSGHPQLLLRAGRAPVVTPTRRRGLEEILTVAL